MNNVAAYMERVSLNDFNLTSICLCNKGLTDADIAPLLAILRQNPKAMLRIKQMILSNNKLTKFNLDSFLQLKILNLTGNDLEVVELNNLPCLSRLYLGDGKFKFLSGTGLPSLINVSFKAGHMITIDLQKSIMLEMADLTNNKISMATKIVLQSLNRIRPQMRIKVDHMLKSAYINNLRLPQLSLEILDNHFRSVVAGLLQMKVPTYIQHQFLALHKKSNILPVDAFLHIMNFVIINPLRAGLNREISALSSVFAEDSSLGSKGAFNVNLLNVYLASSDFKKLDVQVKTAMSNYINDFLLEDKKSKDSSRDVKNNSKIEGKSQEINPTIQLRQVPRIKLR
jgi:hypothetical protein